MEVRDGVPFVFDVAHKECAIEGDAAFGKFAFVGKVTGMDVFDFQGFNLPGFGLEPDTVEAILVAGD